MDARQRITATEREALMRVNLALNFLLREPESLTRRTKMIKRGAFWLGAARAALARYMEAAYRTIPPEQLRIIQRSINETSYTVGIRCPATAEARRFSEWGVIVPIEVIGVIFSACQDHCAICLGTAAEEKGCALRKALDTIPNDTEERPDGGCPYRAIL